MARSSAPAGDASRHAVTIASLWATLVDLDSLDDVLLWPPDVFALTDKVLDASESYRFVVSPPPGVALTTMSGAATAACEWWEWLDGARTAPPPSLMCWWDAIRNAIRVGIEQLSTGEEWTVTDALLCLHGIADEACAGLGSATAAVPGAGCAFRAAARELLAEHGSLSRLSPDVLRVLPRCRVSVGGVSIRSLSRHVAVHGPQVDVEWHRMLSRPRGVTSPEAHANGLMLPWPLRVRSRDFKRVPYTLPQMDPTDAGFFTFRPEEGLDLDLADDVLRAATDEAGTIDFVFLPECAITPAEVEPLETLLSEYGAWCLIAGVRDPGSGDGLGGNWVHVGIRQEMVWRHATQHKHHRWRLDGPQLTQYHLGGALTPAMHWWEAVSIPRRSLQIIDQGAVTIAPLLCEDLARLEPVAELVRSIGPSLVVTLLLDGPQLSSRWTARYASVLADDPGSAVCTLTAYGMAHRCRPPGCTPSNVVALWKDASGQLTEIELENGADAVLIATTIDVGGASTADGRRHPGTTTTLTLAAVQSLYARDGVARAQRHPAAVRSADGEHDGLPPLDEREVSKATGWAEALAEAVVAGPDRVERIMAAAVSCDWRASLGLPRPSRMFQHVIEALDRELSRPPSVEALLVAAARLRESDRPDEHITGTLIEIAVEQRLITEVRTGRLPGEILQLLTSAA